MLPLDHEESGHDPHHPPPNPFTGIGKEVIGGQTYFLDGARFWRFSIQDETGHFDLDPADVYEVVLDLGTANPAETFSRGQNVVIDRDLSDPDHHTVTFRMNGVPVSYTDSGCNGNGTCPERPDFVTTGYLEGYADNLGYITDPADEASMRGWDLVANTDWISTPPLWNSTRTRSSSTRPTRIARTSRPTRARRSWAWSP